MNKLMDVLRTGNLEEFIIKIIKDSWEMGAAWGDAEVLEEVKKEQEKYIEKLLR